MKRYFTIGEAERLLPFLQQALARVVAWRCEIEALVGASRPGSIVDLPETLRGPVAERVERIQRSLRGLRRAGVVVRCLERGIVDLRSRRGGREILLCWRMGEDHIGWWHEPSQGFSERRPLEGLEIEKSAGPN